jgi:Domain of unknown function (DUF5017)
MNKLIYSILTIISISTFFSCQKESLSEVSFDAIPTTTTFKVGDSVKFTLTGNPDIITFYSGEVGNNYINRDRTSRTDGTLKLGFQISADNAAGFTALAANNLKVLVSTNFSYAFSILTDATAVNSADSAMVNTATWKDVTSRFNIPTSGTNATFYNTAVATLTDLVPNPDMPFYLAFKFDAPSVGSLGTNGITINALNLYNSYPDGSIVNFTLAPGSTYNAVWRIIKAANVSNSWNTTSTQLKFTSPATTAYSEDWAITAPLYPNLVLPDKGVTIKNITNSPVYNFAYKFSKPGTYTVDFVASNNRVDGRKELVKEITLTITP